MDAVFPDDVTEHHQALALRGRGHLPKSHGPLPGRTQNCCEGDSGASTETGNGDRRVWKPGRSSPSLKSGSKRGDPDKLAELRAQMARDLSSRCQRRNRSTGSATRRRKAEVSIATVNANFWTMHRECMVHVGPLHLVLGQEHRLEASRCDGETAQLEREGWWCGFTAAKRNAVRAKSESSMATPAGTFVAVPKHWGLEWVWPTRDWHTKKIAVHQGRITMAWVPIPRGLAIFSVCFYHSEGWTERNQQLLEALGDEVRKCAGLWVIGGDFDMEPENFEQFATQARLPGILVAPTIPTFRHGASVQRLDYFVVHHAVACQNLEVQVLEDSGISPHHPVRMRLKQGAGRPSTPAAAHRGLRA